MLKAIVLRGIPGSGKSTYAHELAKQIDDTRIVSADHHFEREGKYHFDPKRLPEAHGRCFREFMSAITEYVPVVIVDNTNITAVEIAPYMAAAEAYGYAAEIRQLNVSVAVAAERNVHGVAREKVWRMARRMENERLPSRWSVIHY